MSNEQHEGDPTALFLPPTDESARKPRKKKSELRAENDDRIYKGTDGYWHGWVTVGTKDNGKPDRRHRMGKDPQKVLDAVIELEKQRDEGTVAKVGPAWTAEKWLTHWLENISKPNVRYKAYKAYATAVNKHLIPGIGGHRLEKVRPEHLEKLYAKLRASGLAPATVHQVHRTARTAFRAAYKREVVKRNVMDLVDAPKLEEREVEPLSLADMQRVIETALRRRNGVRYVVALALGIRQGEALALKWSQLDEKRQTIQLREQIQRRTWEHGCDNPHACGERLHKRQPCPVSCNRHTRPCPPLCGPDCTKHASTCPKRHSGGLVKAPLKTKAGKRSIGLPDTLFLLLLQHKDDQAREREFAGTVWEENDLMFCQETGRPLDPRRDLNDWKAILAETGVAEEVLHAARHSFATLLNELQVTDRAAQGVMGWSSASQAKRYQKMNDPVLRAIADKVEAALWDGTGTPNRGNGN
jgi:integrase